MKEHDAVIGADPITHTVRIHDNTTPDNYANVIAFLASNKHKKAPVTLRPILETLNTLNFPPALIINKTAKNMYRKMQSGAGPRRLAIPNSSPSKLYVLDGKNHKKNPKARFIAHKLISSTQTLMPPGKKPKILHMY